VEKDIIYEDKLIYKRRLDLIVENIVLLDLKPSGKQTMGTIIK